MQERVLEAFVFMASLVTEKGDSVKRLCGLNVRDAFFSAQIPLSRPRLFRRPLRPFPCLLPAVSVERPGGCFWQRSPP